VSSETSFDSKQPKMEPKLVSELSEKKCLFRLFRFQTETASFCVSIKPKQKKANRNKPKRTNFVGFLNLFYKILPHFRNFNASNLKFLWIVANYVTYNLLKFQIDSIKIEA